MLARVGGYKSFLDSVLLQIEGKESQSCGPVLGSGLAQFWRVWKYYIYKDRDSS
jgi:hypothetical protein